MLNFTHVDGATPAHLVLYTLSTCGWCKKTKALLSELGIGYDYLDVDLLSNEESGEATEEIKKWNPACSFPTIVVNDADCITGFQEDKIRSIAGK